MVIRRFMIEGFLSEEGGCEEQTPLADLPANWLEDGEVKLERGRGDADDPAREFHRGSSSGAGK